MADNQIKGTGGVDTLTGTSGRDLIYGYGGGDTLYGGDGNDMIYAGDGGDFLYGGDGDDGLVGGGGGDYMAGGAGNDVYYVNSINDTVYEESGQGIDTVVSSLANYRIGANIERIYIAEGAAVDSAGRANATGNELDNRIKGSSISNNLDGGAGNDEIYGYGGDDIINGGSGNDILDGGDGIDTITFKDGATRGVSVNLNVTTKYDTHAGIDYIVNFENIEGTQFDDLLFGNSGANKILGLGGNDTIRGFGGDDELTGGSGNDTFRFEKASLNGVDKINGFTSGQDKLVFATDDGYAFNATLSYNTASGNGAQFIFNTTSHFLSYDADGAGAGAAIVIAHLDTGTLLQSDIQLI